MANEQPERMGRRFRVVAWLLCGLVGLATGVFALFYGVPLMVVLLLLVVITGGLWALLGTAFEPTEESGKRR